MNVFLLFFAHCSKESIYKYILFQCIILMVPLIVSFLQNTLYFSEENPSKSDTFFGPTGLCPLVVSGKLLLAQSTCEWTRKKRHVYCLMFWNWVSWIILPLHPFTVNTSHQVGKARCLDAMQTLKKGASFFSEPWRRCFNCLFFHFFCLGYVTCHVDGVFLWFRIIIKFTLS